MRDRRGRTVTAAGTGQRRLPRAAGGRRNVVTVRMSDAEYATLTERATAAGVSRQRFVVEAVTARTDHRGQLALTLSERRALVAELLAVRRQVVGIAARLGQLPADQGAPVDVLDAAARALGRLDDAVAALDARLPRPRR